MTVISDRIEVPIPPRTRLHTAWDAYGRTQRQREAISLAYDASQGPVRDLVLAARSAAIDAAEDALVELELCDAYAVAGGVEPSHRSLIEVALGNVENADVSAAQIYCLWAVSKGVPL